MRTQDKIITTCARKKRSISFVVRNDVQEGRVKKERPAKYFLVRIMSRLLA